MRKVDYSRSVQGLHVLVYTVNNETSFFSARKNEVNKIYILSLGSNSRARMVGRGRGSRHSDLTVRRSTN